MAKNNKKPINKAKPSAKNVKKAIRTTTPAPKKAVATKSVKAKPAKKVVAKVAPKKTKAVAKPIKSAKKVIVKAKVTPKKVIKVVAKNKPVKAVAKVSKTKVVAKPIVKKGKVVVAAKVKVAKPIKVKEEKPIKIKAEKPVKEKKIKIPKEKKIKIPKEKKIKIPKEKKIKPPKEDKPKRAKKPIYVKRIIEPTGAILNRFIEYKEEMKKENEEFSKPSHSPVSKYLRFELEHPFNASPRLLYECFTTPSGFAEWFADDVNIKNEYYTFYWDGTEQHAILITSKENKMARYRWLDEPKDTYFEFRIQIDDLTGDVALIITDFAENEREREASTLLWNTQIEALHHAIGAY